MPLYINPAIAERIASQPQSAQTQQPKPADNGLYRIGQSLVVGSNAADEITTQNDLRNPNLKEGNDVLGSGPIRNLIEKGALTAAELEGLHLLAKNHPRLAGVLGIGLSVAPTIAAVHNFKINQK